MNLNNRISQLEERLTPKEKPAAWVAIVDYDGTVNASHIRHGKFKFQNIEEFEAFRKEKGITEGDFIQVIIVNAKECKGPPPKEL